MGSSNNVQQVELASKWEEEEELDTVTAHNDSTDKDNTFMWYIVNTFHTTGSHAGWDQILQLKFLHFVTSLFIRLPFKLSNDGSLIWSLYMYSHFPNDSAYFFLNSA